MEKIIEIIKKLVDEKFSGDIEINFNQGGVRGVKKVTKKIMLIK